MRTFLSIILAIATIACGAQADRWDAPDYEGATPVSGKAISVYRSETCGCCKHWISHLGKHGFAVSDHVVSDLLAIKKQYGVPPGMASCHTAVVDNYVIEGHVPAQDIVRLLSSKRRKDIVGLAVPAMPVGTPGMEDREGGRKDAFSVIAFSKTRAQVHRRYEAY